MGLRLRAVLVQFIIRFRSGHFTGHCYLCTMTKEQITKLQKKSKETRYCKGCDSHLPLSEFYIKGSPSQPNQYRFNSPCKSCHNVSSVARREYHRDYQIKRNFGISAKDYDKMLAEQDYSCAICGTHENDLKKRLAVDHCHKSGNIRSLLCTNCNLGLGNFKDSIKLLKKAIKYLSS